MMSGSDEGDITYLFDFFFIIIKVNKIIISDKNDKRKKNRIKMVEIFTA